MRSWEGRVPAGEAPFPMQGAALGPAQPCPATRVQRLALVPTVNTLAARLGARAPKERLGYPSAAGLGVCDCVNALGWRFEIHEPLCHSWVSPGRRCARLCGMSLERGRDLGPVVACREPLRPWKLQSLVFAGTN